jgi:hypothetical protein
MIDPSSKAKALRKGDRSLFSDTSRICFWTGIVGLVVIWRLVSYFEARQWQTQEAWANEAALAHINSAREHLARHEWDRALEVFQEMSATEKASAAGAVAPLIDQARQGKADDTWAAALSAFDRDDLGRARILLNEYRDGPGASKKDDAQALLEEMDLATSDIKAGELLKQLSPPRLTQFADGAKLAQVGRLRHQSLRNRYDETIRRNLLGELKRRALEETNLQARRDAELRARAMEARLQEAQRAEEQKRKLEELAKRLERIHHTPVFREMTEFLALVHKQERAYRDECDKGGRHILDILFQKPGSEAGADSGKTLEELIILPDIDTKKQFDAWLAVTEEKISGKRAHYKERFRTYSDFDKGYWELFDQEVDKSLDQVLEEVRRPLEDNLAEGLRALIGN